MIQNQIINKSRKQHIVPQQTKQQNPKECRVGLFLFNISQIQIKQLIPKASQKLIHVNSAYHFNYGQIIVSNGIMGYYNWVKMKYLCILGSHGFKNFFTQFQNVKMKNLLVLNLENNNISSIQMIQGFYAPNLDCIYLHGNPITTLKSFRKANFPMLTRLYINILDNEYLSQFQCQNLSLIQNLPRTIQSFQWKKYNSNRWIAKIASIKLKRVIVGTKKYAGNLDKKCLTVICKKNKGLEIK